MEFFSLRTRFLPSPNRRQMEGFRKLSRTSRDERVFEAEKASLLQPPLRLSLCFPKAPGRSIFRCGRNHWWLFATNGWPPSQDLGFPRASMSSWGQVEAKGLVQDAASLLPELCCGPTYLFNLRSLTIMRAEYISRFICHYDDWNRQFSLGRVKTHESDSSDKAV